MKAQKESETKRQAAEQSKKDLQSQINSVWETHGITQETWDKAFAALDKEIPQDQDITIEDVTSKSLEYKADDLSTSILSEFEGVPGDAKSALKTVILENPTFTEADLKDIVKEGLKQAKSQAEEAKAKEMGKKLKAKVKPTKQASKSKKTNNNSVMINGVEVAQVMDWDDL